MHSEIQYYTYPSGLRLVYRYVSSPVTYVGVSVGAGTRDEGKGEEGLAHYIEHGVFKGTVRFSARRLVDGIENVGGEMNAYTTKEDTTYYAAVPTAYTRRVLDILSDMLTAPLFPDDEMQKEKQVIYDEIESYNDSPSELIYDDYESLLFAGHPLSNRVLGTRRTVSRFSRDIALSFIRKHYTADNMVVFAETSKRFDDMCGLVGDILEPRVHRGVSEVVRQVPATATEHEAVWRKHTHQAHVMMGGRACYAGHPDRLTTALLMNILGGGAMSSRLNNELRERHGLVYTVDAAFQPMTDCGYWSVYFATEPDSVERCIELTMHELQRLMEEPMSVAALRKAIRQCSGQLLIADGNRENRALAMAKAVLTLGEATTSRQTVAKLKTITSADIQRVAREIFVDMYVLKYK